MADPRWTGIIEVLVSTLDGSVRWEPDSVVLHLPDSSPAARGGDLDALRLCLLRVGLPVLLDAPGPALPDACLVSFLREMVAAGLMVDAGRQAAA
jgi:hypothetical protein